MPPAAAVYVKTSVCPVEDPETCVPPPPSSDVNAIVPEPSAAWTVTDGKAPINVSEPLPYDVSWVVNVCEPVPEPIVAPEPVPLLSPYVIVIVAPPSSIRFETVIVCPETPSVPFEAVE